MTSPTSAEISVEIDRLEERLGEIATQHAERDDQLTDARNTLTQAIAKGADEVEVARLRKEAMELVEEVQGLGRAMPFLREQIAAAKEDLKAAETREADDRAVRALAECRSTAEELRDHFLAALAKDAQLGELCDRARAALTAANEAERLSSRRRHPGEPSLAWKTWIRLGLACGGAWT